MEFANLRNTLTHPKKCHLQIQSGLQLLFINLFDSVVYYKGLILLFVTLFSNSCSKQIVIKTALWPMQLIRLSERAMCVLILVAGMVIHAWGQNFMDAQLVGSH